MVNDVYMKIDFWDRYKWKEQEGEEDRKKRWEYNIKE